MRRPEKIFFKAMAGDALGWPGHTHGRGRDGMARRRWHGRVARRMAESQAQWPRVVQPARVWPILEEYGLSLREWPEPQADGQAVAPLAMAGSFRVGGDTWRESTWPDRFGSHANYEQVQVKRRHDQAHVSRGGGAFRGQEGHGWCSHPAVLLTPRRDYRAHVCLGRGTYRSAQGVPARPGG